MTTDKTTWDRSQDTDSQIQKTEEKYQARKDQQPLPLKLNLYSFFTDLITEINDILRKRSSCLHLKYHKKRPLISHQI